MWKIDALCDESVSKAIPFVNHKSAKNTPENREVSKALKLNPFLNPARSRMNERMAPTARSVRWRRMSLRCVEFITYFAHLG